MAASICPYLGIEEDAETAVAFPSPRNRCFRSGKPAMVSTVQQDSFCLREAHGQCPVYLLRQQVSLPAQAPAAPPPAPVKPVPVKAPTAAKKPVQPEHKKTAHPLPAARNAHGKAATKTTPPPSRAGKVTNRPVPVRPGGKQTGKTRRLKDSVITGLMGGGIMAILLAAIIILPAYGSRIFGRPPNAGAPMPTETIDFQSGVINQPSLEYSVPYQTLTATMTASVSPTMTQKPATATKKPTARPTRAPTRRPSATREIAAPPTITTRATFCGVPYGWIMYVVRRGDTLTSLGQRTNTSVYQLQSANCMGASTLIYTGMTFYLPFIPAPIEPTRAPFTSTPVSTSTRTPALPTSTTAPSNTPVPVQPSPSTEAPTKVPPTVEPSPIVPTIESSPEPAPEEPTAGDQKGA